MHQMSHNGWYRDKMPSKSPELSNDRLNSSYFLFCCHRKEFTASSRESPVSRAGGRLAEQKAGGRMPDAPAMDETWITDFLEQGRTAERLDSNSNCCFVPRTFCSRSRYTNASKSLQMQCMAGGKKGCCSGDVIVYPNCLFLYFIAASHNRIKRKQWEISQIFRWQQEIGHSLAISETSTGPYRKQVWWGT